MFEFLTRPGGKSGHTIFIHARDLATNVFFNFFYLFFYIKRVYKIGCKLCKVLTLVILELIC